MRFIPVVGGVAIVSILVFQVLAIIGVLALGIVTGVMYKTYQLKEKAPPIDGALDQDNIHVRIGRYLSR